MVKQRGMQSAQDLKLNQPRCSELCCADDLGVNVFAGFGNATVQRTVDLHNASSQHLCMH